MIAKLRCLVLNQCATYSMMRFVCGKKVNRGRAALKMPPLARQDKL